MSDNELWFQPRADVEYSAEMVAHYMRARKWCLCMSCVMYVCEGQRELASLAIVVLQRQTGVPCLARAHEQLDAPPRPAYRITPPY